jgi:SAM-dependent methyltransferase
VIQDTLAKHYERDKRVWDDCAETYEEEIVEGHPDVTAYESFEEDFLDRLLTYLIRDRSRQVHLYDVGCGSARLHLRYGLKVSDEYQFPDDVKHAMTTARRANPGCQYDPELAKGLVSVGGVDFSSSMIRIAERKMEAAGLADLLDGSWYFEIGSAFDLEPMPTEPVPVLVSVCNSIGVTQGPEGAVELFKSMRRAVEKSEGIAIISSYRGEAVESYALGNYESTMNVCGQPRWLTPDDYASPKFTKLPRAYKRAHDPDPEITVDVLDEAGKLVKAGFVLQRDPTETQATIGEGHIRTFTDYESHWYSFEQIDAWIDEYWHRSRSYHIAGSSLDKLRAEPAQFAILDAGGWLGGLLERWGV